MWELGCKKSYVVHILFVGCLKSFLELYNTGIPSLATEMWEIVLEYKHVNMMFCSTTEESGLKL